MFRWRRSALAPAFSIGVGGERISFDRDHHLRMKQALHFHQRRGWRISAEQLAMRSRDRAAALDIGDEDASAHHVRERHPGPLEHLLEIADRLPSLRAHLAASHQQALGIE